MLIYEDKDFSVTTYDKPHHSRENGGHIVIKPKKQFAHVEEMDDVSLTAMVSLAKNVGTAMKQALANAGINIVRINYQINGNWAYFGSNPNPFVHLHLYGRTANEKHPDNDPRFQAFPEALCFPNPTTDYYDNFSPLTEEDCMTIHKNLENKNE
jgi:diadenosine tetraphosphate (Ap4A) HIT family hydrolase